MFRIIKIAILAIAIIAANLAAQSNQPRRINIGYFEAGKYPVHSVVRDEYFTQLNAVLPDSIRVVSIPEGYRSAEWKRDNCREMAYQLTRIPHLDMILAVGPWVVEDLIAAGFKKPIIALHQFEPRIQGLLDSTNRPIVSNLTVSYQFDKIESDLAMIKKLTDAKQVGFLYFPSADETEPMVNLVTNIGKAYDMKIFHAEGYDNYGTFAFYKAFADIKAHLDAIYLPPMWGFDAQKLSDFLKMLKDKQIPAFTAEGNTMVEREAFATNNFYGIIIESRFNALKTVQIINGATPADLPVLFKTEGALGINLQTANICGIDIPSDLVANSFTIPKENQELTQHYTLNDALNRVLTQNPAYLGTLNLLDIAESETGVEKSAYLPQLSADFNYRYLDDNLVYNTFNRLDRDQIWGGLHLEQKLFSLSTIKGIKVARQKEKMSENSILQNKLNLELLTSLAYIDVLKAKEIVDACQNNKNIVEHNLEVARAKNQFGETDTLEVLLLESEKHRLTQKIIEASDHLENSQIIMNRLFNLPASEPFEIDQTIFTSGAFVNHETNLFHLINTKRDRTQLANNLYQAANSSNPVIQQHELKKSLNQARLEKNKASFMPEIGLQADFNLHDHWNENYLDEKKSSWTVGGFLRLPIYLGGERFKQRRSIKAEINMAEYERDETALKLMENIYSLVNKLANDAEKLTPSFQAKKVSFMALEEAIKKYTASDYEVNDLIRNQENSLENELNFIINRYDYYTDMAYLIYHSGLQVSDDYSNFVDRFHQLAGY